MATQRQKKLAKAIVENLENDKPKTAGELLENVGYSKETATGKPGEIIEQIGVQEELIALGFTEHNAKNVVSKIMNDDNADNNARLKAADMTFKVHGTYAPDKAININANINVENSAELMEMAKKVSEQIKKSYARNGSNNGTTEAIS